MFLSEHGQDGKCEPGNMAVQQQIGKEYRRGGKATEQILIVALAGLADILARICVLLYQRDHGGTRTLNYRTWVLLVALAPFAWVAYLLAGRPPRKRDEGTICRPAASERHGVPTSEERNDSVWLKS